MSRLDDIEALLLTARGLIHRLARSELAEARRSINKSIAAVEAAKRLGKSD
ncbi:hypothetical protein [Aquamicrobium sp. LC103]|uniref:hypothetical protein n=1 Tax=Aquamicrobium sp. LC103 TaxID=1120658 RepID=UPI001484D42A|nr:hypothetical protein [Aquamicrobium sp. LC103]